MPLHLVHRDISGMDCGAIVDPTDSRYSGSGGADLAIHRAAGKRLDDECAALAPIYAGEVAATGACGLPCRYIIHTVGPVWQGGTKNEYALLRSCYLNALFKARELGVQSVAFPLISAGTFGFPKKKVLRVALEAISDYLRLAEPEPEVYLCVYDRASYELPESEALQRFLRRNSFDEDAVTEFRVCAAPYPASERMMTGSAAPKAMRSDAAAADLGEWLRKHDDSFAVTLLKLIDKKGMTDVQCYKKANVSKGTFWKINNDPDYRPSKATVLAFAIALELSLSETERLLKTVGFSLSHSSTFDLIIEFYISNGIYDIFEINSALYQYDQVCLGC